MILNLFKVVCLVSKEITILEYLQIILMDHLEIHKINLHPLILNSHFDSPLYLACNLLIIELCLNMLLLLPPSFHVKQFQEEEHQM